MKKVKCCAEDDCEKPARWACTDALYKGQMYCDNHARKDECDKEFPFELIVKLTLEGFEV